jgi:hypothetical protein
MAWILLTYKLPSNDSTARVAVWREVRRAGALHLQQAVVAFPDTDEFRAAAGRFRELVESVGGETLVVHGDAVDDGDARLIDRWNAARDAEYGELVGVCERFLREIDHEFEIEKFTTAELEEEEAELEKLHHWHGRIKARDIHGASRAARAAEAVGDAEAALSRYADAVFERSPA